ncbi:hypothetical protein GCM10027294_49650 [Marinactinospora endophytica]
MPHPSAPAPSRRLRVALYADDSRHLGPACRSKAIADALAAMTPAPETLVFARAAETAALHYPPGCELRRLGAGPGRAARELAAALRAFAPDVLIVDRRPDGAEGELAAALDVLRRSGRTKIVLGLLDVMEDPARAAVEWARVRGCTALRRWYDAVWVYGDRGVADPVVGLGLPPDLRPLVSSVGYLGRSGALPPGPPVTSADSYVLGLLSGAGDAEQARAFAAMPLPSGVRGLLVTGSRLPAAARSEIHRLAAGREDMTVLGFVSDPGPWLDGAAAVVTTGGYGAVCEALGRRSPLLVLPRSRVEEERVRALRLAEAGAADALRPGTATAGRLGAWVAGVVRGGGPVPEAVDVGGLSRIAHLVCDIAGARDRAPARA